MSFSQLYPEHQKMKVAKDRSQAIEGFLKWLQGDKNCVLARYVLEPGEKLSSLTIMTEGSQQLMAEYFGIDLKKVAEEKDRMYGEMVASSEGGMPRGD